LLEALVEILSQMSTSAYVVVSLEENSVSGKGTSSNQQAEDEMGGPSKTWQSEESAQNKTDASVAKSDLSFHANLRYFDSKSSLKYLSVQENMYHIMRVSILVIDF